MGTTQASTLIGCTDHRGQAWMGRDDLQDGQSTRYPGFIPVADMEARVFNWEPIQAPMAFIVPCEIADANSMDENGNPCKIVRTQTDRVGVLRSDTLRDLGTFKSGVVHESYAEFLIRQTSNLLGDTLGISAGGTLNNGARGWVEVSVNEAIHDDRSGMAFRPNLLSITSMDGSLSNTRLRTCTILACDNQISATLLEGKDSGMIFKRKHTRNYVPNLDSERSALALVTAVADEFTVALHQLLDVEVNKQTFSKFLDAYVTIPQEEGRGKTLAEAKRSELEVMWCSDERVTPFGENALALVQLTNTWDTHCGTVRGSGRAERNTWRTINGKQAESDKHTLDLLERVLVRQA